MSESLIAALTAWGTDTNGALERLCDDKDLWMDCIRMFYDDPSFADLKDALDKQDLKSAFDYAHTLKGVSANLGLNPLYARICAIVEPLRAGKMDGVQQHYAEMMETRTELGNIMGM